MNTVPLTAEAIRHLLGERVREARIAAGYATTTAFAADLNVSRQAVDQWEAGHAAPSPDRQIRIAQLLGRSHSELFGLDEQVA